MLLSNVSGLPQVNIESYALYIPFQGQNAQIIAFSSRVRGLILNNLPKLKELSGDASNQLTFFKV